MHKELCTSILAACVQCICSCRGKCTALGRQSLPSITEKRKIQGFCKAQANMPSGNSTTQDLELNATESQLVILVCVGKISPQSISVSKKLTEQQQNNFHLLQLCSVTILNFLLASLFSSCDLTFCRENTWKRFDITSPGRLAVVDV